MTTIETLAAEVASLKIEVNLLKAAIAGKPVAVTKATKGTGNKRGPNKPVPAEFIAQFGAKKKNAYFAYLASVKGQKLSKEDRAAGYAAIKNDPAKFAELERPLKEWNANYKQWKKDHNISGSDSGSSPESSDVEVAPVASTSPTKKVVQKSKGKKAPPPADSDSDDDLKLSDDE